MLTAALAVIGGLILLVWSADRFVYGASGTAANLGVSPLLIGLTVVGIGTSAPEILVAVTAALDDSTELAIGNAIGSNIANMGLVLGVTAIFSPLVVNSRILHRELPLMIGVILLAGLLLWDQELGRVDGIIMIICTFLLLGWIVREGMSAKPDEALEEEFKAELPEETDTRSAILWMLGGLLLLVIASKFIVWGAVEIAVALGVSEFVIGLTIIAIGTSLPELAASLMSAVKDEADLAIGNVIGSNMFNMLPVLGLPGIIAPQALSSEALSRDYPFMLVLALSLVVMAWGFRGPGQISRIEGTALTMAYAGYMLVLFMATKGIAL